MAGTRLTLTCLTGAARARLTDGGRPGLRHLGIPRGGPADAAAMVAANAALGQPPTHPCLELTLGGGHWRLEGRGYVAVNGADVGWQLDGRALPRGMAVTTDGRQLLRGGYARPGGGIRAYLAVAGRWDRPRVRQSVEPGLPGVFTVEPGSEIHIYAPDSRPTPLPHPPAWSPPPADLTLPVTPGPEWDRLDADTRRRLLATTFRVGAASNRQGIRLEGKFMVPPLPELISSPVLVGTVQLTPDGPILLGPDAQTVGGYPRVLQCVGGVGAAMQLGVGGKVALRAFGPEALRAVGPEIPRCARIYRSDRLR